MTSLIIELLQRYRNYDFRNMLFSDKYFIGVKKKNTQMKSELLFYIDCIM